MPDKNASLEAIIAEIRQQSEAEVESIRQAAAREQAQITQRARTESKKIQDGIIDKARHNAEQIRKRSAAQTHLEIKKSSLQSRLLIGIEIRQQFENKLLVLRLSPEYAQLLKELIAEGIVGLGTDKILLSAGDRERTILSNEFLGAIEASSNPPVKLRLEPKDLNEPGVLLYSADKRRRFDNRLTRYSERLFEKYQWQIMQKFSENNLMR
ncbi:MAG: V-type ATP synthase subunit E family protein [Candidatus Marinimicrobia bacterium]|nr:V-type ATP synthase subunit E family protein [Candidatus Neomarinimicrobiota bacterium]MDD5062232.1 V-type ATP synthase subunit E family protein [Candidatus Neomarinimicrobiota bacterium]MDD5541268.1 V-type ATP synthase subunit E family protein [Candidatus Neomarinimicrobiota bacterium]